MLRAWGIILFLLVSNAANAATPELFKVATPTSGVRDFYLYSPAKPSGLIVMLHGCKTTAAQFDQGTEMSKFAAAHHMAVLYPEQSVIANYDHCWNWFWGTETSVIAAGIQQIQKRFHLKSEQTYLMGMSAGAAQAAILANCHRGLFTKVLLHSGLQYLAASDLTQANDALQKGAFTDAGKAAILGLNCSASLKPIEFMVVHGTSDLRVNPINGVQAATQLVKLNQLIALKNHQATELTAHLQTVPASQGKLGYTRQHLMIAGKEIGSLIQIEGLVHEWAGGNPVQPRNNPNAPNVIELFFQSR